MIEGPAPAGQHGLDVPEQLGDPMLEGVPG
jgi:hypothetical protein